ncbi:hypothetical protein HUT19_32260 [Streptomyces sp. NA02950]|uniref:discoidin domain-containing protein n=1 Tax=Streptomyces sp. NA02950 TaxID=2742137 RepID=UPI0015929D6D|nr:discoidin domain-containing protein [Streptomyces sp. NA02950]QKV95841.1 hypothetical protein HUT19_32260 [Streptomyces sp. NA02950]
MPLFILPAQAIAVAVALGLNLPALLLVLLGRHLVILWGTLGRRVLGRTGGLFAVGGRVRQLALTGSRLPPAAVSAPAPIDHRPGGDAAEPAYRAYLHGPALRDLRRLYRATYEDWRTVLREARTGARQAYVRRESGQRRAAWTGLGYPVFLLGFLPVVLLAAVLCLLAAVAQLALWAVVSVLRAVVWWAPPAAVDRIGRWRRDRGAVCPHLECGRPVALPVHRCPACGAGHRRLVPNGYGALRHVCRCGARLPASPVFGARRLETSCPFCARPLPRRTGRERARTRTVVLAGGPDSGQSVVRYRALARARERVEALGGTLRPEAVATHAATLTGLRGADAPLVVYDPPGAAFTRQESVDALDCLRRADGLVLVVDALALPSVRRSLGEGERESVAAVPVSPQDPSDTVVRVLHVVATLPARRRPRRIAVVLTKSRAVRRALIGAELPDPATESGAGVRGWLERSGGGNLVRTVERFGGRVRYLTDGADEDPTAETADAAGADAAPRLGELLLWAAGVGVARRRRLPWPAVRPGSRPAVRRRRTAAERLALRQRRALAAERRWRRIRYAVPGAARRPLATLLSAGERRSRTRRTLLESARRSARRRPDGWVPGGREGAAAGGTRMARGGLVTGHLAGLLALPLALALLIAGALPPGSFFGLPERYDTWRRPLADSVHDVDLAAYTPGADWPRVLATYSGAGTSPAMAQDGHDGDGWSTKGSPNPQDQWVLHFGTPVRIHRIDEEWKDGSAVSTLDYRIGTRWVNPPRGSLHFDLGQDHPGRLNKESVVLKRPVEVSAVRVWMLHPRDNGDDRLRSLRVWGRSSSIVRLRPSSDGGRLRVANTAARELAVEVRPPVLPTGWRAVPAGRAPRAVGPHGTVGARWTIKPPEDAAAARRGGPVAYAVRITEDGRTVTAWCRGVLTAEGRNTAKAAGSGYRVVPTTC